MLYSRKYFIFDKICKYLTTKTKLENCCMRNPGNSPRSFEILCLSAKSAKQNTDYNGNITTFTETEAAVNFQLKGNPNSLDVTVRISCDCDDKQTS